LRETEAGSETCDWSDLNWSCSRLEATSTVLFAM
jgi:hypothetical protein